MITLKSADYREDLDELKIFATSEGRIPAKFDGFFLKEYSGYIQYGQVINCELQQDESFILTVEFTFHPKDVFGLILDLLEDGKVEALCALSVEDYNDLSTEEKQNFLLTLIDQISTGRVREFAREHLSLALKFSPVENSEPEGFSKFGGLPKFPKKLEFPKVDQGRVPLFIAQLDLGELANSVESTQQIKDRGFLYIFAHVLFFNNYHNIEDFSIFYSDQDYDLETVPLTEEGKRYGTFPEMNLLVVDEWNLPPAETSLWEETEMEEKEEVSYTFLKEVLDAYNYLIGIRILGHPDQVQGCVLLESEFKEQQLAWYNPDGYDQENFVKIYQEQKSKAKEWRLLMELDSMDDYMFKLPDFDGKINEYRDGVYYLMIRKEVLPFLDFSRTQCIYQST